MTKDEIEKAVATFEFPPFRAGSIKLFSMDDAAPDSYALLVDGCLDKRLGLGAFITAQEWLDYYAEWQSSHSV